MEPGSQCWRHSTGVRVGCGSSAVGVALRRLTLVPFALLFVAAPASPQVSGTVRAPDLDPVPVAEVLLWGHGRLLDRVLTQGNGRFGSRIPSDSVQRISIHHIGYHTEILSGPTARSPDISVVLEPRPIPLPELEVVVSRDICLQEPSQYGYDIWLAASRRYASDTAFRGGLAAGHQESGDVSVNQLGAVEAANLVPRMSRWRGARPGQTLEDRVDSEGYAWPLQSGVSLGARHLNWVYPSFEERHAYHFATAAFGERHRFHVLDTDREDVELVFCPPPGERTGLRGRLQLSGDSMFVAARWSILSEDPVEGAGGEVIFGEVRDATGQRHLVSARGSYWRHSGRGAENPDPPRYYWQVIRINTEWIVSPDSEWPDCRPRWCH